MNDLSVVVKQSKVIELQRVAVAATLQRDSLISVLLELDTVLKDQKMSRMQKLDMLERAFDSLSPLFDKHRAAQQPTPTPDVQEPTDNIRAFPKLTPIK